MLIYYDEAGRGPLAGPVCVGLVARCEERENCIRNHLSTFPSNEEKNITYKDSKKLSPTQREKLYEEIIKNKNIDVVTTMSSASYIDQHGIVAAIRHALCKGIRILLSKHEDAGEKFSYENLKNLIKRFCAKHKTTIQLILDGNTDFGIGSFLEIQTQAIVKGDDLIQEISMASICAKVVRDRYMENLALLYPQYGFEKHKGYGTKEHYERIELYGPCKEHRKSYLKNMQ